MQNTLTSEQLGMLQQCLYAKWGQGGGFPNHLAGYLLPQFGNVQLPLHGLSETPSPEESPNELKAGTPSSQSPGSASHFPFNNDAANTAYSPLDVTSSSETSPKSLKRSQDDEMDTVESNDKRFLHKSPSLENVVPSPLGMQHLLNRMNPLHKGLIPQPLPLLCPSEENPILNMHKAGLNPVSNGEGANTQPILLPRIPLPLPGGKPPEPEPAASMMLAPHLSKFLPSSSQQANAASSDLFGADDVPQDIRNEYLELAAKYNDDYIKYSTGMRGMFENQRGSRGRRGGRRGQEEDEADNRDPEYRERRRKNNEAAKRSRDARKAKEEETTIKANYMEGLCRTLMKECSRHKKDIAHLQMERESALKKVDDMRRLIAARETEIVMLNSKSS